MSNMCVLDLFLFTFFILGSWLQSKTLEIIKRLKNLLSLNMEITLCKPDTRNEEEEKNVHENHRKRGRKKKCHSLYWANTRMPPISSATIQNVLKIFQNENKHELFYVWVGLRSNITTGAQWNDLVKFKNVQKCKL